MFEVPQTMKLEMEGFHQRILAFYPQCKKSLNHWQKSGPQRKKENSY